MSPLDPSLEVPSLRASVSPVDFLQHLIRCPSVTPDEGGALKYVETVLKKAHFETHWLTFSEADLPPIHNLYAQFGSGRPHFVFAGHTDVVPPGDRTHWRFDPFTAEKAEEQIWGRGAVDMKGGVAAFMAAALRFLEQGEFSGTLSILLTGDEESQAINGTVKVLEWAKQQKIVFDHCIVGEPSSRSHVGDRIKIGRRGSLTGHLTVKGKQGHVAYPHFSCNPLPALAHFIQRLTELELDRGNEHFQPSHLEFVTVACDNQANNVIPEMGRASFNIRYNDIWTKASLREKIEKETENYFKEIQEKNYASSSPKDLSYQLTFAPSNAEAFILPAFQKASGTALRQSSVFDLGKPFASLISDSIQEAVNCRPEFSTVGGTSDARFIYRYCEVLELGLVGTTMHQVDERTSLADLEQLTNVYQKILENYFRNSQQK